MRGRGGGPSCFSNGSGRFNSCYRCEGSLDSVHGVGHWKGDCTTPLKCIICNGPHYLVKCPQFNKEEHYHLLYDRENTQRASIVELPQDNSWALGHETGNMAWGWGLQGGDEQGAVQGNAVSISGGSETSDTHHSTSRGGEW